MVSEWKLWLKAQTKHAHFMFHHLVYCVNSAVKHKSLNHISNHINILFLIFTENKHHLFKVSLTDHQYAAWCHDIQVSLIGGEETDCMCETQQVFHQDVTSSADDKHLKCFDWLISRSVRDERTCQIKDNVSSNLCGHYNKTLWCCKKRKKSNVEKRKLSLLELFAN